MVVNYNIQDLLDLPSIVTSYSLPTLKENALKIEFEKCGVSETVYEGQKPILPFANSELFHANISDWKRLTAIHEDCKDVYEITFDISGSTFTFNPGDTVAIIPQNKQEDVEFLLNQIELQPKADLPYTLTVDKTIKGAKIPPYVPVKSTLRYVLTHCLDLRSVIKKLFILALSKHTKDENEKKVLEYICSKEGSNTYNMHILDKNLCILDLLRIFKTCKPPIEVLLNNLPRLLPRPYSIVNSQLKNPDSLKICFSTKEIGNNRKGLTTGWLEEIILNTNSIIENGMKNLSIAKDNDESGYNKIPIYLRKNVTGFSMPDIETPLLLIGPGTGVAPYISFLQEREALQKKTPEKTLGEVWLFYGCRNPKLDFIYEKEVNEFLEAGVLNKLFTAVSRVEDSQTKYIQDALTQNGEAVTNFIKSGASVFICGDLKTMASQIRGVLTQCLVEHDGQTLDEAEKYLADLQKYKKYSVDMWS